MQRLTGKTVLGLLTAWMIAGTSRATDWPTYGGDARRSGVTDEELALPLSEAWQHRTHAPRPAWPQPAKQDFWHEQDRLTSSITFDWVMHVTGADGAVFYGSSANDKVTCLDAASGRVRWFFFTEGPVRLAPSVADGKVYVGSDDGHVYCLDAGSGQLLWKYRPGPEDRRIPGNGRMISRWPVRTGVLVEAGTAYVGAGVFPTYGVYLCALRAADGMELWKRRLSDVSPQGYLLASDTRLYVPSGRTSPAVFDRRDGRPLGTFHGNRRGGSYALLDKELLVYRGEEEGSLAVSDRDKKERLALFRGLHLAVRGPTAFIHSQNELAALDRQKHFQLARARNRATARKNDAEKRIKELRKLGESTGLQKLDGELTKVRKELDVIREDMERCWIWRQPCAHPHALVLTADLLVVGGKDEIAAVRVTDGTVAWKGKVTGKAFGLAVAGGRLFVSTDEGRILCFH